MEGGVIFFVGSQFVFQTPFPPLEVFDLFPKSIFAHELGHSLGADPHDNEFYTHNPGDRLLMWNSVGPHANIWSPEAKRRINQHATCLATVEEYDHRPPNHGHQQDQRDQHDKKPQHQKILT